MVETIRLVQLRDENTAADAWSALFIAWQHATNKKTDNQCQLLKQVFTLRGHGYELHIGEFKFEVWLPTILNQVVKLDGRSFFKCPRYRVFRTDATFDIVCSPVSPYYVEYIDIDLVDEWGKTENGERLFRAVLSLGEVFGVPVRLHDHAEVCSMLPTTFISFINNPERGRAAPNKYGFKRNASVSNPRTRQSVAAITRWRIRHQTQLMYFIGLRGKINKDRIAELSEFMQAHLPDDLRHYCTKLTLTEYVKCPKESKNIVFSTLV
jgi:hypothetical protein